MSSNPKDSVHLEQFNPFEIYTNFDFGSEFDFGIGNEEATLDTENTKNEYIPDPNTDLPTLSEHLWFKIKDGEKDIGDCSISVQQNLTSPRGEDQLYPDSWFESKDSENLLPIMEVESYNTISEMGKGYGRRGYQKIYELSLEKGCEGRIITLPTFNAGNFYEKLGMQTPEYFNKLAKEEELKYDKIRSKYANEGHTPEKIEEMLLKDENYFQFRMYKNDSPKYFDPTPENLAKLYKNSAPEQTPINKKIEELRSKKNKDKISISNNGVEIEFNPETGLLEYADEKLKDIRRKRDEIRNIKDPLVGKEKLLQQGLEEIGLKPEDMGKTGDSLSGEVTEKHQKIANSQIEDAKFHIMQNRKQKQ